MIDKAINNFLIGFFLLFVVFIGADYVRFQLPAQASNGFRLIGLFLSFLFSLLGLIKGLKQIKKKENSFIYNSIAIIGSVLILVLMVSWGLLLLFLNFGGFPSQD